MKHTYILLCHLPLFLASCSLMHGPGFDPRAGANDGAVDPSFAQAERSESIKSEWLKPPAQEYVLGPGDRLEVELIGEDGTQAEAVVTPDGKIYYSLLSGLTVNGKTINQVREDLTNALKEHYRRPEVMVSLKEVSSQRIWVLGRLYAPGIYPLKRPMRVLDAISLAGGLYASDFTGTTQELADLKHSFLKRGGKHMPVDFEKLIRDGDLSQNIYLQPNDYIYLPSSLSNEVYIFGAVMQPRSVGFMNEMNIVSAIGHAAGAKPSADLKHVTIIRGSLVEPKYAVVNLTEVMQGKASNIRLQPGDIVYVPEPGQISFNNYAKMATESFVRVIGVNEGSNAVGLGTSVGVGLNADGSVSQTVPASSPAKNSAQKASSSTSVPAQPTTASVP